MSTRSALTIARKGMVHVIDLLKDLIEGGFIGQAIIGTLVWGLITYLIVQRAAVDNRLYDAGFIVIGYLFHMTQTAVATRLRSVTKRKNDECIEALNGGD